MQNTETPFDDKVERVMASLPVILQSYSQLQRHRYSVDISKYTTSSGITTLTLRKLMSFGDIVDEDLLALYDKNLREDVAAKGFTSLVQLTWNRNSYEGNRKFTFDLTASAADILELSSAFTIKHRTANSPPATENPSVAERVVPLVTPSLKRPRIQKKLEYSLVTLSRYSKDIETKFLTLVQDTLKSANDELRQQVIKAVIARLESRFQGFDIEAGKTNNLIVANIKGLVTSMTKFGRNVREQIRFKENIALAISGTISYQRLIDSSRTVEKCAKSSMMKQRKLIWRLFLKKNPIKMSKTTTKVKRTLRKIVEMKVMKAMMMTPSLSRRKRRGQITVKE
jgi:hypothetical protein